MKKAWRLVLFSIVLFCAMGVSVRQLKAQPATLMGCTTLSCTQDSNCAFTLCPACSFANHCTNIYDNVR